MEHLKDAEYHSIRATTLYVAKYFHLSNNEINETLESRKSDAIEPPLSKTKIYNQTIIVVSHLRKAKFLKDFPGTKSKGFFAISDEGFTLLKKNRNEIKNTINSKLKYIKTKKPITN